jgi:hypothetical protein
VEVIIKNHIKNVKVMFIIILNMMLCVLRHGHKFALDVTILNLICFDLMNDWINIYP